MNNYLKLVLAAAAGGVAVLVYKKLTCPCSHAASSPATSTRPAAPSSDDKDTGDGYANLSDVDDDIGGLPSTSTSTAPCTSCNGNTGVVGPSSNLTTVPVIDIAPSTWMARAESRR